MLERRHFGALHEHLRWSGTSLAHGGIVRVLVTGGAGFIGSHLLTRLVADGHTVASLDRLPLRDAAGVTEFQVDLLDVDATRAALARFQPEAVLHLAARTDLEETQDVAGYRDNIEGVESLVSAIAATPSVTRWVCTSSQLVCRIGYTPRGDEDYTPDTRYGESKVRTEQITRARDGGGVPWTIVRPTTIWGPRMNPHYLRFFSMLRDGRYFEIGKDRKLKSYGYVGNSVAQYAALLAAPISAINGKTMFLADYELLSLSDWAESFRVAMAAPRIRRLPLALAKVAARIGDVVAMIRPTFPLTTFRLHNVLTSYAVDTSPMQELAPTLPFSVDDGVRETARWLATIPGFTHGAKRPS